MKPGYYLHISPWLAMVLASLFLVMSGCATNREKVLDIDTRHVVAIQNMTSEITSMLEGLGYRRQNIQDPSIANPVPVAEKFGQYRMLFTAKDNESVRVDVHIRKGGNRTGLHFYESGASQPGAAAMEYYYKLRERVVLEFGAGNVSENHSFTTP